MEELLTLPEFAKLVGYSKRTIFKRIEDGTIVPHLKRNGRNYFVKSQINIFRENISKEEKKKLNIGYYRVSSNKQKSQLDDQLKLIEVFSASRGIILDETLKDLGSGMNFKRKNFLKIIDMILNQEIKYLIITYEDRLTRFGFSLIDYISKKCNVEILVINSKTTSPEEELVEDLMTIIHVFSSRLYGLRSNKRKIKEVITSNDLYGENKDQT